MLPDGVYVISAGLAGDKINSYIIDEVSEGMQDVSWMTTKNTSSSTTLVFALTKAN